MIRYPPPARPSAESFAPNGGTSPLRSRSEALIQEKPGLSLQDLADQLGVSRTAAAYHVRRLVRANKIMTVRKGRRILHFPSHMGKPVERNLLATMRLRMARLVLEALREDPQVPWRELARRLDVASHTVRWHIGRLSDEGLIHVLDAPGQKRHVVLIHPDVRKALGQGSPPDDDAAVGGAAPPGHT